MFDRKPKVGDELVQILKDGTRQYYTLTEAQDGYVRGCRSELSNTTTIRSDLPRWDKTLEMWIYRTSY